MEADVWRALSKQKKKKKRKKIGGYGDAAALSPLGNAAEVVG